MAVTPSNVPPGGEDQRRARLYVYIPPSKVPPRQVPRTCGRVNASVCPLLSSVPTKFTVPPVRLNVPNAGQVNGPPRFTVESVTLIVPVLSSCGGLTVAQTQVEPVAVMVPLLLHVPLSVSISCTGRKR